MPFTILNKDEATISEGIDDKGHQRRSLRYFGKGSPYPDLGPQGFVVHLINRVLGAHFHPVDQFQVLLGGASSRYQGHELSDMTVHYADAFTPYGPLSGEDPPMRFFTLRAMPSDFTAFMPEERDKLEWIGKRNTHVEFEHLKPSDFPSSEDVSIEPIVEREDDGLQALSITAGPNAAIVLPATHGTSGQYVFVADGSVEFDGRTFDFEALGWQPSGEDPVVLRAGPEGARVFAMLYPSPSTVYQHGELLEAGTAN